MNLSDYRLKNNDQFGGVSGEHTWGERLRRCLQPLDSASPIFLVLVFSPSLTALWVAGFNKTVHPNKESGRASINHFVSPSKTLKTLKQTNFCCSWRVSSSAAGSSPPMVLSDGGQGRVGATIDWFMLEKDHVMMERNKNDLNLD